ncbi:carbohydrate ABC transporter permease [Marinomonas foliarum]|uniref:Sugar ABC transporter permease n=1 Tax=Marinomonas foliarum TaxID=491950 RepID=A0ABX7IJA8_9GAMM|nr:sugar ABC transporter permease [Marinomonas foliarum]QRV22402.1 sugar ABC transporter permease [Marinomonas foliarum]
MPSFWKSNRNWLTPVLLLAPGLILFFVVIILSSIETFWISLHSWDGFGAKVWVGLDNYKELLDDPQFYVSLRNNIIWIVMFLSSLPLGLAIALLLNQKIRGMRLAKSLFFMPLVLSTVTVGVIFGWFYDPTYGLLALIFHSFGAANVPALLSDDFWVTPAIVLAALWPQVAFCMVLFLAGLNNLDEEQINAGRIDGAKGLNMLRFIVIPQLKQISFIALAITIIGALRSFDIIAVMTSGGPFGSSTVLAYQMYEQSLFSYRFGYGAAIATVLFLIMSVFIVWYLRGLVKAEEK